MVITEPRGFCRLARRHDGGVREQDPSLGVTDHVCHLVARQMVVDWSEVQSYLKCGQVYFQDQMIIWQCGRDPVAWPETHGHQSVADAIGALMEGTIGDAISWRINDGHSPRMSLGLQPERTQTLADVGRLCCSLFDTRRWVAPIHSLQPFSLVDALPCS